MEEIWKDVLGYEGIYQVSNLGMIKSLKCNKEIILKPVKNYFGYLQVTLSKEKTEKIFKIHRLVAIAFLGQNDFSVNHINSDKTDNRLENLEYVSSRENNSHAWQNRIKTSKYTGVCWHKKSNKWQSSIRINGKLKSLGTFDSELDAHNAYLKALEENNLTNKYSK